MNDRYIDKYSQNIQSQNVKMIHLQNTKTWSMKMHVFNDYATSLILLSIDIKLFSAHISRG